MPCSLWLYKALSAPIHPWVGNLAKCIYTHKHQRHALKISTVWKTAKLRHVKPRLALHLRPLVSSSCWLSRPLQLNQAHWDTLVSCNNHPLSEMRHFVPFLSSLVLLSTGCLLACLLKLKGWDWCCCPELYCSPSCLSLSPSLYFLLPRLLKAARVQTDERPISILWRLQGLWESSGKERGVWKANTAISINILKFGSGAVLTICPLLLRCHFARWWCMTSEVHCLSSVLSLRYLKLLKTYTYLSTLLWLICSMKVKQPKRNRHCNSLHDLQYYSSIIMIVICSSYVLLCPPSHDLKQHMIHSEGFDQGLSPFLLNHFWWID